MKDQKCELHPWSQRLWILTLPKRSGVGFCGGDGCKPGSHLGFDEHGPATQSWERGDSWICMGSIVGYIYIYIYIHIIKLYCNCNTLYILYIILYILLKILYNIIYYILIIPCIYIYYDMNYILYIYIYIYIYLWFRCDVAISRRKPWRSTSRWRARNITPCSRTKQAVPSKKILWVFIVNHVRVNLRIFRQTHLSKHGASSLMNLPPILPYIKVI